MTLHERYCAGEHLQVYQEIKEMGNSAFDNHVLPDIEHVLHETFSRVAYNLKIIYDELINIGYEFNKKPEFNFQRPLHPPLPDTDLLLKKLIALTKPFGHVPLSLQYFYKIAGGVNFGWHYDYKKVLWTGADPIQVASIDDLVRSMEDEDWGEMMREYLRYEPEQSAYLELAADAFTKDNISGGPAYSLALTPAPSIDSLFMNEPHNTDFIDYLRICFDHGGFPGISEVEIGTSHSVFFDSVRPHIKSI